jgi:hypothetical protein
MMFRALNMTMIGNVSGYAAHNHDRVVMLNEVKHLAELASFVSA